ncbi:hypothetical protein Hanom_Chr13g01234501 [Helianthus anomalus]
MELIKTKISHTLGVCVRENDQEEEGKGENPSSQESFKLTRKLGSNPMHEFVSLMIKP